MNSRQGTRVGALLLLSVARAARALGAGEDTARGEDQDMAVRKLLLEFAGEACKVSSVFSERYELLTAAGHGGSPAEKGRGQR